MGYRDMEPYYYEDITIRDDTHYYSEKEVREKLDEIEGDVNKILGLMKGIRSIHDLTDLIEAYELTKELSDRLY